MNSPNRNLTVLPLQSLRVGPRRHYRLGIGSKYTEKKPSWPSPRHKSLAKPATTKKQPGNHNEKPADSRSENQKKTSRFVHDVATHSVNYDATHDIATLTGLEPATSAVTGRRANQLRHRALVPPTGFEPVLPP